MTNLLSDETIKKLNDDSNFKIFIDFAISEINGLDTVDGLDRLSDELAGQEAKIRSKARERLLNILNPFISFKEKKDKTKEEVNRIGKKYGLPNVT